MKCNQCASGFEYMDSTQSCVCPKGYEIVGNMTCVASDEGTKDGIQLW